MLMLIKHYYFEPLDDATVTREFLINTERIIRVTQAEAAEHYPAGCHIEYLDITDRVMFRLDLTLENFYEAYWALRRMQSNAPAGPK